MQRSSTIRAQVDRIVEQIRSDLRAAHGWTWLEVEAHVDAATQRVVLQGEVAVHRMLPLLHERVTRTLGPGWQLDLDAVRAMSGGPWYALSRDTWLWRGPSRNEDASARVTEVFTSDGPVQSLGQTPNARVVRLRDGTVGWLHEALAARVEPARLSPPHGEEGHCVVAAARARLGWPYRLGGVSSVGIDCSALVSRAVREGLGVWVPRHSADQLGLAPCVGSGPADPGDLVFVWTRREARCHVGIVTGPTVIHASLSRGQVVEDALEAFVADSSRTMHVPLSALIRHGRAVAGAVSLVAAGVRLGFSP